ncbi:MAG: hypothetical protein ACK5NT_12960 [Pyrinomonadaceae bacterium]
MKTTFEEEKELHFANSFSEDILLPSVTSSGTLETISEQNNIFGDQWISLIKATFLFLPGAFLLFAGSGFLFYAFFDGNFGILDILLSSPWLALSSFMTIYGLSANLRNPKSLLIPISIISVSAFTCFFPNGIGNIWSALLFPMALIVSVFVSGLLNDNQ